MILWRRIIAIKKGEISLKYRVVLAGKYPQGTFERLKTALNRDSFDFVKIENEEEYHSMKDADILI